jgi:hypothetical protein
MVFDPSVNSSYAPMPTMPPPPSPSTFAYSGGRTEIQPKTPIFGYVTNTTLSAAQYASIAAYNAVTARQFVSTPGGTVVATFLGSDIQQPYAAVPVGLPANLPSQPNQYFPVVGALLPDGIDTSIYVIFVMPSNVVATTVTAKLALCIDPSPGNADITGSTACFGVSVAALTSGKSTVDNSDLPVDVPTVTSALPTAVGTYYLHSMLASSTSLVPGALHLMRVTRKSKSSSLDTNLGRLLLINLDVIAS